VAIAWLAENGRKYQIVEKAAFLTCLEYFRHNSNRRHIIAQKLARGSYLLAFRIPLYSLNITFGDPSQKSV
jgi:hypothetical protein